MVLYSRRLLSAYFPGYKATSRVQCELFRLIGTHVNLKDLLEKAASIAFRAE